jgi:small nuclear ribonucleoprotein (snRNP)-like protein
METKTSSFVLSGEFIKKYEGKRIEIQCVNGDVMRGVVGGVDWSDLKGFALDDVTVDGKKTQHDRIVDESEVASFTSIEGENPPVRISYPVEDICLRSHQGETIEAHLRSGEVLVGRVVQVDKKPRVELRFTLQTGQGSKILKKGEVAFYYSANDGWRTN